MQDQLICSGCRRVVQYRRGVAGVCCPGCNTLTAVNPSAAANMSELICSGCPTLLFYNRGASNIRCPSCNRLNSTRSANSELQTELKSSDPELTINGFFEAAANQIAHLTCGQCRTTLMHSPGASTVQCATCRYVNHVRDARPQTVLVENPKTLDDKGKLVSNVVVGVTSWKR
uniref:Zinc finger LSD1-type domain-containing protein n=1 Tax=Oryza brachyantha TaxID=4533 RepID=J3MQ32_ORYBR